jgi:uncharacterized protein
VLKLNVLGISEDPGEFTAELSGPALGLDPDLKVAGPVQVSGQLYRVGPKVIFRGRAAARFELTCARCLRTFTAPLSGPVDVIALPAGSEAAAAEPAAEEPESEALAVVEYHGEQFDLAPEIRTALVLALPMKPLCAETCPGLCPECGELLTAAGPCHCGRSTTPNAFAVLERLRGRNTAGPGGRPGPDQEE